MGLASSATVVVYLKILGPEENGIFFKEKLLFLRFTLKTNCWLEQKTDRRRRHDEAHHFACKPKKFIEKLNLLS